MEKMSLPVLGKEEKAADYLAKSNQPDKAGRTLCVNLSERFRIEVIYPQYDDYSRERQDRRAL